MITEADDATRTTTVLLRPGVYPTASALKVAPENAANATTSATFGGAQGSSAVVATVSGARLEKNRRLRHAMAAKEATMSELTQLIAEGLVLQRTARKVGQRTSIEMTMEHLLDKINNSMTTAAFPTAPPAVLSNGPGIDQVQGVSQRFSDQEIMRARDHARLEALVYDLRRELEAAGHTLRDQTEAMKSAYIGMTRMGPHRMIKTHREQQPVRFSEESTQNGDADLHHKLHLALERVGKLEGLLVAEQKRCKSAEGHYAESQSAGLQSRVNEALADTDGGGGGKGEGEVEDAGSPLPDGKKEVLHRAHRERHVRDLKSRESSLVGTIRSLEDALRTARRAWNAQEKELKRYIQILESTMMRMERHMPHEVTNMASLFNLRLRLVGCEGLLNRRNNGVGFIDPFLVLFSPTGDKVLETLPRDDTNCPRFDETEDVVVLKVARGSPWNVVFEVYSRGANDGRLFLGQAKVPVVSLLEDITAGKESQHSVNLHPREREPDREIVQHAHNLGIVTFTVAVAAVVGAVGPDRGSPAHVAVGCKSLLSSERRLMSPKRDGEELEAGEDILMVTESSPSAEGLSIRVAGARAILKRKSGGNPNPYVVAYHGEHGEEMLRTPLIMGSTNPFWGEDVQAATITLFSDLLHGCIVFQVYDHGQDGQDEFLGETRLSKRALCSGREWYELMLLPRKDEPLAHILEHRHRLGKLLVQCTRSDGRGIGGASSKKDRRREEERLGKVVSQTPRPFGPSASSEILHEESAVQPGDFVLHPFRVQVTVEACKGLWKRRGKRDIFVRIVAPNFVTYTTKAVPQSANPSWTKENGSTVISLHPLDPGIIGFHVMDGASESGKDDERHLGYAQLSVVDLFRHGFGAKELRLGVHPSEMDAPARQRATGLGSIRVTLSLISSVPSPSEGSDCTASGQDEADPIPSAMASTMKASISQQVSGRPTPTLLCMRIYVKEGSNLLDCDQSMFNVLGVTDPRVMVWIGPDHVFTVPEKRDTVNPKWDTEEAEFFACVQSTQIIRFEVQDVDVDGFDSMGCAAIHASEVVASPGEHKLPVMLHGKQYGVLTVVFTVESRDCGKG